MYIYVFHWFSLSGERWLTHRVIPNTPFTNTSFFCFPQFYWEIIDVHYWVNLRHTVWWFDLHILWNDYHNKFSKYPSCHVDTIKEKEEKRRKKISSWKLPCISYNIVKYSCYIVVPYTPSNLSYNFSLYLVTTFLQLHTTFPHPTSGSYKSDNFFYEFFCFCFIIHI